MQQVVVIHGGDSFTTYEEYLDYLKDFPIELEGGKGWKSGLSEALGPAYQVILPRMPNAMNARYAEWKLWFEKYFPYLEDGVILVGHSLGGSFLAKYLSEELYPKKIKALMLVAAPLDGPVEGSGDFLITKPLAPLENQVERIFLYHSTDDEIVPYAECEKYRAQLPKAEARTFTDRGHFLTEEFPELVADLKGL